MSRKKRNLEFDFVKNKFKRQLIFGGALLKKSHAKEKRPLSRKHPMHVVLRSSLAKGDCSMLQKRYRKQINIIITKQARARGIKIIDMSNVGNHIHLFIKISAGNKAILRKLFNGFIRAVSGLTRQRERGAQGTAIVVYHGIVPEIQCPDQEQYCTDCRTFIQHLKFFFVTGNICTFTLNTSQFPETECSSCNFS